MSIITTIFVTVSVQLDLPKDLLASLCYVESNHKIHAVAYNDGKTHSYGVCQIKLETAKDLGFKGTEKELMKPENNIYYAGLYLKKQIQRYECLKKGVIAYNRGNAKGLTTSKYQIKVYNHWKGATNE